MKILLIEDSRVTAQMIQAMLSEEAAKNSGHVSFQVTHVESLRRGLKELGSEKIDLVLLDLSLPESKGLETFDKVYREAPEIPIVILTGTDDETLALEVLQRGAQDYLVKGQIDGTALVRVIRYAIERQQVDRMKDEFVSTVSHELKTPMSVIREGACLLLDEIPGKVNEEQRKLLTTMRDHVDWLSHLLNNVLEISRLERGKVQLTREWMNLSDVAKEVLASFECQAKEKGLCLELELKETNGRVYADPKKMREILSRLVENSLRFTEKGSVKVALFAKADQIECCVTDTGIGISKSNLPKVFEKFQQFHRIPGPGEQGTGLGLAIAQRLVELHAGKIKMESTEGKGTQVSFSLPAGSAEKASIK